MKEGLEALSLTEDEVLDIFIENEIKKDKEKINNELGLLEKSLLSDIPVVFDSFMLYPRLQKILGIDLLDSNCDRLMKNLLKYMIRCKNRNVVVWKALNVIYSNVHFRMNTDYRSDKYDLARNLSARIIEDYDKSNYTKIIKFINDFVYKDKFSEAEARRL